MDRFVLDLEALAKQVEDWIKTKQLEVEPLGAIAQSKDFGVTIFATCNMICMKYILGVLHFDDKEKDTWADAINRFQDQKTGIYEVVTEGRRKECYRSGVLPSHMLPSSLYSTAVAVGALQLIEREPRHPLYHHQELISDWKKLEPWLKDTDCFTISTFISPLVAGGDTRLAQLHRVVDWLDGKQDPNTGYWSSIGTSMDKNELLRMAYHLCAYVYENLWRPIHHADALIDSTLSLMKNDEFSADFEERVATERPGIIKSWINVDGLYILARASRVAQNRRPQVIEVAERLSDAVLPKFADPVQFAKNFWDTNWTVGCISMLPILQELVPHRFNGRRLRCTQDVHGAYV